MKLPVRHSLQITLTACLLLLGACGKKENKVNSNLNSSTSPISVNNPIFNGSSGSTIVTQYNSIRNSVACLAGNRLTTDVSFFVSGNFTGTTIPGNAQWQPGMMSSGTVTDMYVGVSYNRDLMFLTKVTNGGSQVLGYNVTLSFCEMQYLISNDRALTNFRAPYGITINTATSCGYGLIAAAMNTLMTSQQTSIVQAYTFPTTFTAPNCGR